MRTLVMTVILALAMSGFAQEKKSTRMIRVDFKSEVNEGMVVNATLPLSFFESVKPQIEQVLEEVQVEGQGLDLAGIWQEVKNAGPTEFVSIKSGEVDLKVSTTETHLHIQVDEKTEGHDIQVTLPLALIDALLNNGEIDYDSIVDALESLVGQDLVTITSEEINGRVWIE